MRSKDLPQEESRPTKRSRQEDSISKNNTKPVGHTTLTQISKVSRAKDEDVAFPRGGASVLTPLEHKQINIEAARDVLFEQQTASHTSKSREDGVSEPSGPKTASSKRRKSKSKVKISGEQVEDDEEMVKIEGLSYKVFSRKFVCHGC